MLSDGHAPRHGDLTRLFSLLSSFPRFLIFSIRKGPGVSLRASPNEAGLYPTREIPISKGPGISLRASPVSGNCIVAHFQMGHQVAVWDNQGQCVTNRPSCRSFSEKRFFRAPPPGVRSFSISKGPGISLRASVFSGKCIVTHFRMGHQVAFWDNQGQSGTMCDKPSQPPLIF